MNELDRLHGPCAASSSRARAERRRRSALTADRIFIERRRPRARATRCRGSTTCRYLTNSSMMDVDFAAASTSIVVGGSYIGLEFGQMFRRFGSAVTIVEMAPRLIAREDEDVSTAMRAILEREGIDRPH